MSATVQPANLARTAEAALGPPRDHRLVIRTFALLSPLLLLTLGLAGEIHAALVFGAAGRAAAREAARTDATLASIRSAAAMSFGDALSPNRYSVLLSVNTGNGFTPDPTGQLLCSSTRGGEIRVQITRLSGGLAQDLLDSFRLPGSCKEMRTEWVVHRE